MAGSGKRRLLIQRLRIYIERETCIMYILYIYIHNYMIVYECTCFQLPRSAVAFQSHHMTQKILKNESPVPVLQVLQFNTCWYFGDFCLDYKQFVPTTNEVRPIGFSQQAIGQVITTNEPWRAHHRIKESTWINQPMYMSLYWDVLGPFLLMFISIDFSHLNDLQGASGKISHVNENLKSERLSKVLVMTLWWLFDRCSRRLGLVTKMMSEFQRPLCSTNSGSKWPYHQAKYPAAKKQWMRLQHLTPLAYMKFCSQGRRQETWDEISLSHL